MQNNPMKCQDEWFVCLKFELCTDDDWFSFNQKKMYRNDAHLKWDLSRFNVMHIDFQTKFTPIFTSKSHTSANLIIINQYSLLMRSCRHWHLQWQRQRQRQKVSFNKHRSVNRSRLPWHQTVCLIFDRCIKYHSKMWQTEFNCIASRLFQSRL